MAFWSDLGSFSGVTTMDLDLDGALGNAQNRQSAHRGKQQMIAVTNGNQTRIYTKNEAPAGGIRSEATVYWLPWSGEPGKGAITEATWEAIEKSEAQYILTSKFTGCRLVVDDIGVSHVAYGAGNAVPAATTSADRDRAEGASRLARGHRRTMSFSAGAAVVYDINGYAIAIGYRDASHRWKFRVYRVDGLGAKRWDLF